MSLDHLYDIKTRLANCTPGPWKLNCIGSKNYLMWFGGDWPEEKDEPNYEFISNAPKDIEYLINEIELVYETNKNQQLKILDLQNTIEKLEKQIIELSQI